MRRWKGSVIRLIALFFLVNSSLAFAVNRVDCHDVNKVAKEAVAYALVGAYAPFTTHACFKNEKFVYFHPEKGYPTGEALSPDFIWFDKTKDTYSIESVKLGKDNIYDINVDFVIGGKKIHTVYKYAPDAKYAHDTGECGFVVNYKDGIFRKDCVVHSRLPSAKH